ncbi:unnamed protein product, partial [Rotaria sp. Silwood1]
VIDEASVNNNIQNAQLKLYANQLKRVAGSGAFLNRLVITQRFRLPIGTYVIIPSTYKNDKTAEFLLRVFTEKKVDQTVTAELTNDKSNLTEEESALQGKKVDKLDDDSTGPDDDIFGIIIEITETTEEIIETTDEIDQATDAEDPDAQSDSNADANNEST